MINKRRSRGLSLIEVVIVFAITAVLVAATMPNFQDYAIRAKVIEGLDITTAAQDALVRTCMGNESAVVKTNQDAGYLYVPPPSSENFIEKIVLAADCAKKDLIVMVWTGNTGANPEPIIEMSARIPSGVTAESFEEPYYWNCRIIRGDFSHVPSNCRTRYKKI